jgi:E3 ubiquitin-protein ligase BRE1
VEKFKKKASAATAAANGQGRYVESDSKDVLEENVMLKRMLKCSSCQQRFKTHTITRCYHLFCKECIDARLETRQRKCPSCSIGFGAHDVQQVYF